MLVVDVDVDVDAAPPTPVVLVLARPVVLTEAVLFSVLVPVVGLPVVVAAVAELLDAGLPVVLPIPATVWLAVPTPVAPLVVVGAVVDELPAVESSGVSLPEQLLAAVAMQVNNRQTGALW